MRTARVGVAVLITLALLAGCGKSNPGGAAVGTTVAAGATGSSGACPTTETVSGAKTKFVLHAGLASGAFYHWIYGPLRAGSFRHGASHRLTAILKAGLAAAFVVHELRIAKADAAADPTLCHLLIAPINAVENAFGAVVGKVRHGSAGVGDVAPVDQAISSLKQQATTAGAAVTDQVPSASQLANPSSTGS